MTEEEYLELLKQHDWYYYYSDDHRVYTKGRDNAQRLLNLSQDSPKLRQMYEKFINDKSLSG